MNDSRLEIPRRNRVDLMTPAELAIRNAILAVEDLAADPRLTDAVCLLSEALEIVADFVDNVSKKESTDEPITEEWLRAVGFKWHQVERQPSKHWLLWIGGLQGRSWDGPEDLGIEVAYGSYNEKTHTNDLWHCWLRCDSSHRYHRFLHIRSLEFKRELIVMIEGLTGQQWNPENNRYGCMRRPEHAIRLREEADRLDRQIMGSVPWSESEKDDTRVMPLREHLDIAIESGKAK